MEQVERDNARIAYQAAISLTAHEGSNIWVRYGLMLVAHTIILSVVGFTLNFPQPAKSLIGIGLSVVGLVLCALWSIVNGVGWRYFFYWIFSARELEELHLAPIQVVGRAFPVADEREISVVVGGRTVQLPIFQRDRFLVVLASKLIICIIGVLHGALLLWFLIDLLR
jgi:hypothetical protein